MSLPASGRHYLVLTLRASIAVGFVRVRRAMPGVVVPAAGRQLQDPAEG